MGQDPGDHGLLRHGVGSRERLRLRTRKRVPNAAYESVSEPHGASQQRRHRRKVAQQSGVVGVRIFVYEQRVRRLRLFGTYIIIQADSKNVGKHLKAHCSINFRHKILY